MLYLRSSEKKSFSFSHFPLDFLFADCVVDFDCVEQYVSVQSVVESSLEQMTEECLEMRDTPPKRVTDQQAKQILQKYTGCDSASAFQALSTAERDKYIHKLKKVGLSVRQISRLTGMTYYVIQKAE